MEEWIEKARKRGFEIHGVTMWVFKHNLNSYSAAKILMINQSTLFRWMSQKEKNLPLAVCALFRVLNRVDLEKIDTRALLEG